MRLIAALIAVAVLAGCATYSDQQMASRHLQTYIADKKPLAERGELKWSEYYKGLYNFSMWANAPGDVLSRINEMTRVAEDFEAGRISRSDAEYRRRAIDAENRSAVQARVDQQNAAILAASVQLAQASGPRLLAPVAPIDSAWDWDLQRSSNGNLVWVCRGIQSGQYAVPANCAYRAQIDSRWPGY